MALVRSGNTQTQKSSCFASAQCSVAVIADASHFHFRSYKQRMKLYWCWRWPAAPFLYIPMRLWPNHWRAYDLITCVRFVQLYCKQGSDNLSDCLSGPDVLNFKTNSLFTSGGSRTSRQPGHFKVTMSWGRSSRAAQ